MESFLPSEIARLVLGYLDDHKCEAAYEMFLKTSPLLEECLKMREEGRKFRTQVLGLNLSDILYEYSAIHSLVQERLKKVDPETADSLKHSGSLLDKITFLLNATSSGQTMLFSITLPPGKSPSTVAHVRKRLRTSSSSDKKKDYLKKHFRTHNEAFSPIRESNENEKQSPNLETTSLSSLPGNSSINVSHEHVEGTDIVRTPKRKNHPINCRRSRSNSRAREESEDNLDLTALTKAFLDNHELHEKIAENINKVICTPDLNANTNVSESQDLCSAQNLGVSESNTTSCNNFTVELDNAIKQIVQNTESDPVFENFLHEIIEEYNDKDDERAISGTSTPTQSTPETGKKTVPLKQRLRNSKTKQEKSSISSELNTPDQIDHQNAAAIECIISMTTQNKTSEQPTVNAVTIEKSNVNEQQELHNVPRNNNENQLIIGVPEPESEQELCIETSNTSQPLTIDTMPSAVTSSQNVMINNQNTNLLMIGQQNAVAPPSTIVITEPQFTSMYQQPMLTDNRFIVLSGNKLTSIGSQFLTVQPAQLQLSQPATILNDGDLLRMPTVIMCEEQQPSNAYVLPQTVYPAAKQTVVKRKGPVKIMPKNTTCIKNLIAQEQQNIKTENVQETDTVKYTISVQAEPVINSNAKPSTSKAVGEICGPSVPMISLSSGKKDNQLNIGKIVTPDKSDSKIQMSLSTPRNGRSHIRALDFSTPTKESPTVRKAYTSPKSIRGGKIGKLSRHSRSSLFTSPLNLPIATRSPHAKLQGDWDNSELIFTANTSSTSKVSECSTEQNEENKDENKKSVRLQRTMIKKRESLVKKDPLDIGEKTKEVTSAVKNRKLNSWDQDLRLHVAPMQTIPKNKIANKKNKRRNAKKIINKQGCSTTNEIKKELVESELEKMDGFDLAKTDTQLQNANKKDNSQINKKPVKTIKAKRKTKKLAQKTELNVKEEPAVTKEENIDSKETYVSEDNNVEQNKEVITEAIRNIKSRVKKKCNLVNAIINTNQETNRIIPCDSENEANTNEVKSLTILSPPVMNVNKRNLIEYMKDKQDNVENSEAVSKVLSESVNPVLEQASTSKDDKTESNDDRVTPNMLKPTCSNAITAKINLTPVLETPVKFDSILYPNTPNICTSFGTDASITKLLQQNCGSVDLSSIMTPNFPLTPSFPMTPNIQTGDSQSSYASRPTDYSNSSSYYQPSDSEQNQRFEQVLIEECKKIDSSSLRNKNICTSTPDKILEDQINELSVPPNDSMQGNNNPLYTTVIENKLEIENNSLKTVNISNTLSSSNSESDISHEDVTIKESNVTVIHIKPGQSRRSGKHMATLEKLVKTQNNFDNNKSEDDVPKESFKITIPKKQGVKAKGNTNTNVRKKFKSNVTKSQTNLLQELEIKRKRTISELKHKAENIKPQRKPGKSKNMSVSRDIGVITRAKGKLNQDKIDNKEQIGNKKSKKSGKTPEIFPLKRKSTTPKKSIESVAARLRKDKNSSNLNDKDSSSLNNSVEEDNDIQNKLQALFSPNTSIESYDSNIKRANEKSLLNDSDMLNNDEDIPRLHISSDEETNDSSSFSLKNDPTNLIKSLKERGIHLIPKAVTDTKSENIGKVHDEDNPFVINSQKLNLQISNFDIEDNIPQNRIERFKSKHDIEGDKIEIKSDIYLDKSKIIDISKIESSRSVVTDTIFGKSIKNTEINDKIAYLDQEEKKTNSLQINNAAISANTSISSDCSEFDLEFHVKIITEDSPEYIKLSYNESNPSKKTLSNYNFALLDKQITAKVFLEELNIEQDRLLSVTPFIELLTLRPPQLVPKLILKPLNILYNELVDDSSVDTVTFEENNDYNRKKSNKIKGQIKPPSKSPKSAVKAKNLKTDQIKKKISIEQYKNKTYKKKIDASVEDKVELNSEEDSLMTFAVTGMEKKVLSTKKRKASDSEKQNSEKRIKTNDKHALLKNIDVDSFLSMVHGPSNSVT